MYDVNYVVCGIVLLLQHSAGLPASAHRIAVLSFLRAEQTSKTCHCSAVFGIRTRLRLQLIYISYFVVHKTIYTKIIQIVLSLLLLFDYLCYKITARISIFIDNSARLRVDFFRPLDACASGQKTFLVVSRAINFIEMKT